jgi:hypothetical protein
MTKQFFFSRSHFIPVSWPFPALMDSLFALRVNSMRSPAEVP